MSSVGRPNESGQAAIISVVRAEGSRLGAVIRARPVRWRRSRGPAGIGGAGERQLYPQQPSLNCYCLGCDLRMTAFDRGELALSTQFGHGAPSRMGAVRSGSRFGFLLMRRTVTLTHEHSGEYHPGAGTPLFDRQDLRILEQAPVTQAA